MWKGEGEALIKSTKARASSEGGGGEDEAPTGLASVEKEEMDIGAVTEGVEEGRYLSLLKLRNIKREGRKRKKNEINSTPPG